MKVKLLNDMHVHLRQGDVLRSVTPHVARRACRALVMPNTIPAVLTPSDAHVYFRQIMALGTSLKPLMTCKLLASTSPELVREAKGSGIVAFKLYPDGVTTNSQGGVSADELVSPSLAFLDAIAELEFRDIVLCLHGELPGIFCLDREAAFLPFVRMLRSNFPKLRIVLEHITTREAVELVREERSDKLAATITLHHLLLTLDDVVGGELHPHNFCKPLAKRSFDRDALLTAALSDEEYFFFGSDLAPHLRGSKECASGCAGVYTAPVMLELLVQIFDECGVSVEEFGTSRAARFYRFPLDNPAVELVREPWTVPDEIDGIVPFYAGREIKWKLRV